MEKEKLMMIIMPVEEIKERMLERARKGLWKDWERDDFGSVEQLEKELNDPDDTNEIMISMIKNIYQIENWKDIVASEVQPGCFLVEMRKIKPDRQRCINMRLPGDKVEFQVLAGPCSEVPKKSRVMKKEPLMKIVLPADEIRKMLIERLDSDIRNNQWPRSRRAEVIRALDNGGVQNMIISGLQRAYEIADQDDILTSKTSPNVFYIRESLVKPELKSGFVFRVSEKDTVRVMAGVAPEEETNRILTILN